MKAVTAEDRMLRAMGEYLEEKGFSALVGYAHQIRGPVDGPGGSLFEVVLRFTGGKRERQPKPKLPPVKKKA